MGWGDFYSHSCHHGSVFHVEQIEGVAWPKGSLGNRTPYGLGADNDCDRDAS